MLPQRWNLEGIFAGGSRSEVLAAHVADLEGDIRLLRAELEALPEEGGGAGSLPDRFARLLESWQGVLNRFIEARSFIGCLTAQDVKDEQARLMEARAYQTGADLETLSLLIEARLLRIPEAEWEALLADPRIEPVAWVLREKRSLASDRMSPALESLATDLSVSGYHAWNSLYEALVGRITIPWEADGKAEPISVGQAHIKFSSHDPAERNRIMDRWDQAWGEQAELFSALLNNVSGYRLALYRHRGWESVLKEPLAINRMSRDTLEAMWEAVRAGQPKLAEYLNRKAKLIGKPRLDWQDLSAPLGEAKRKVSFDEAAAFIQEHFRSFSPAMAAFADRAFRDAWIEAEERAGKAPGGFCTDFPISGQTRIFMTYGGDADSVATLAHELGHAFHTDAVLSLPPLNQQYTSSVAETASTLAELITVNAAIRTAPSPQERLALLDGKLQSAVTYLMNIHTRFVFETRFYEARRSGPLSVEELNRLMAEAQRESYQGALGRYHPLFWASKGHFYFTGTPFYNFPYTFGYLFSAGVYAHGAAEGRGFEGRYIELLRDTGRATVEELARRHLGADLTRPEFWMTGVRLALADVEEFLRLTAD